MKLLIVEDSASMRRLIRNIIGDLAESIEEREDGALALSAYADFSPDWVLMDVRMKEMDGLAATRQIKAEFPDAKVLIVTDYGDRRTREEARLSGACDFVAKDNLLDLRGILLANRTGEAPS